MATSTFISSDTALQALHAACLEGVRRFEPPPKLTVSEWADKFRQLSSVDSAEPGQWDTSQAEYERGIQDAFTDPDVEDIVLMTAAQVGKTAIELNCAGYIIHCDPGPVLHVLPTKDDAEEFSKDRFTEGLVASTPCLRTRVREIKSGAAKEKSTIQHKRFPGGRITFAWANSPSRLSSRPIRYVFGDEVDKWKPHPTQGDPLERARKRSATYLASRRHIWASTPTLKGDGGSVIDAMYQESSKGHYVVPCPDCGVEGTLGFFADSLGVQPDRGFHIGLNKDAEGHSISTGAFAVCHACGSAIEEKHKYQMVLNGHWEHEDPANRTRGFHLSATISPWSTWSEMADKFLKAGKNTEKLRIFWNEELGEPWELRGEMISDSMLMNRREIYKASVPAGVAVLTAGVDVQKDRLEVSVKGWGPGLERWGIAYRVLTGDTAQGEVWAELDAFLDLEWEHELGPRLSIVCTFIDAGFNTKNVYDFCRPRLNQHIFPCIGRANEARTIRPICSRPAKVGGCELYTVGVDQAKEFTYRSLRIDKSGPGFCHFPVSDEFGEEYFAQLTAEKLVAKTKGFVRQLVWEKGSHERNEALDAECYALAALEARNVNLALALENIKKAAEENRREPEPPQVIAGSTQVIKPQVQPSRRIIRNNWINSWRN